MNGRKMPQQEVANLLRAAAGAVEEGDSFQGSLRYSCWEDGLEPGEFMVEAFIRHGNSMGQGGCILIRGGEPDAPLRDPNGDYRLHDFGEWLRQRCDRAVQEDGIGTLSNALCEVMERFQTATEGAE